MDNSFNRFVNLDSSELRIINYLKNSTKIEAERIWKLLAYNDENALFEENLTKVEKDKLIYKDTGKESDKRVFTFPYVEESFLEQCSLLRIYVDSIIPKNHIISVVNFGFDIICHNKISNVKNDSADTLENGRPIEEFNNIDFKNRNTVVLQAILSVLNGADIGGVGVLQFNGELCRFDQSRLALFNGRTFYGHKLIMSCQMSGVSDNNGY
jgi:hypothetical protein